jgi:hypothetical protein
VVPGKLLFCFFIEFSAVRGLEDREFGTAAGIFTYCLEASARPLARLDRLGLVNLTAQPYSTQADGFGNTECFYGLVLQSLQLAWSLFWHGR